MDLNEKVAQLMNITTSLRNEVNELKGKDLATKLDELEQEKDALKEDILDLRRTLVEQNEKILSLIRQQNEKLFETIDADKRAPQMAFNKNVCEYSKLFPIKSLEDLDNLEKIINTENSIELIAIVRQLLQPKGLIKNIASVMAVPCIMQCNVDGHHNKRRLLNSPKFMNLVYQAAYDSGCSQKTFLDDFRRGFKMVKNRHNKNLCRHRQMQRKRAEQASKESLKLEPESEEDMEILPDDYVKTEEIEKIYFY